MTSLVVLKFATPEGAEQGLQLALGLQKEHLLKVVDAAIVSWPVGKCYVRRSPRLIDALATRCS